MAHLQANIMIDHARYTKKTIIHIHVAGNKAKSYLHLWDRMNKNFCFGELVTNNSIVIDFVGLIKDNYTLFTLSWPT